MKSILSALVLLASFAPTLAVASNSSPYVTGQWNFQDTFKDFSGSGPAIVTRDTVFVFLNPTKFDLTLEYAFFDEEGKFCGCDRDDLAANGSTRYTMTAEVEEKLFSRELCPTQTNGQMKAIVFTHEDSIGEDDALQNGLQIHLAEGNERTESDLNAVPVTRKTIKEMKKIHAKCDKFIKSRNTSQGIE
jgi:hypothetical protein